MYMVLMTLNIVCDTISGRSCLAMSGSHQMNPLDAAFLPSYPGRSHMIVATDGRFLTHSDIESGLEDTPVCLTWSLPMMGRSWCILTSSLD